MGCTTEVKCLDCGNVFNESYGGGFVFHLVRCDQCGKTKSVGFDELGVLHDRYLKGLSGCYCVATTEHDKSVQENSPELPITEEEYYKGIDLLAGKCRCGGEYLMDAPPRCPECRSVNLEEVKDGICIMYD